MCLLCRRPSLLLPSNWESGLTLDSASFFGSRVHVCPELNVTGKEGKFSYQTQNNTMENRRERTTLYTPGSKNNGAIMPQVCNPRSGGSRGRLNAGTNKVTANKKATTTIQPAICLVDSVSYPIIGCNGRLAQILLD